MEDSETSTITTAEVENQASDSAEVNLAERPEVTDSATSTEIDKKKKKKKKKSKAKTLVLEAALPWKVLNVKDRGRCAVATRAIKPGEVVIAEQAVAFVPRLQYRKAICHICGVDLADNVPIKECSSCNYTIFCENCLKFQQELHNEHCLVYKEISDIAKDENCDADLLRLVFNLALKKTQAASKSEGAGEASKVGIVHSSFQDAMTLQTHRDKASGDWLEAVHKGCARLHKVACREQHGKQAPLSCTIEDLEVLAALVNTNAHGMGAQGVYNTDVALGIFPFVSMLNHSCRPNCCFASDGSVMYVRAVQDIPKGTELCLSYINLYEPRRVRKTQLAATKHFDCNCERCTEPMKASIDRFLEGCVCPVRGCGGVVIKTSSVDENEPNSTTWVCDLCSRALDPDSAAAPTTKTRNLNEKPWELVARAEERFADAVRIYGERRFKEARRLLEDYVSEFSGKLHHLHVLIFDALTPLMNCCRAMGDAEEGLRVCRLIVQCMEKVLPGPSLELANFYFCLGEMYAEKAQSFSASSVISKRSAKQAQEAFQRVKSIRDICLGKPSLPA